MVISTITEWSKIRYFMFLTFATSSLLITRIAAGLPASGKQKRQLFREHVLPQLGGKIPDSAFIPDRLTLNRLNQGGIFTLDGIYFERDRPEVHLHPKVPNPETIKVIRYSDNSYTTREGHNHSPNLVDTTYVIREPTKHTSANVAYDRPASVAPQTSLKLFLHNLNDIRHTKLNDVVSPKKFAEQILVEFAPYLKKVLEIHCD